ncbi:MAG: DUF362 domain-containing protein [Gemmatimonadota bacterium]
MDRKSARPDGRTLIERRQFLRTTGLGLAAVPLLGLDGLPFARARSRVAVVRTSDRAGGVTRALGLLDPTGITGRRVVVKPNFNSADPAPASTHPEILSRLVTELHERGARSVTLGARDLRFEVVDYERITDDDWVHFGASGTHWPEGYWLPRHVVDAEYNVSTACLKTHQYGGVFTMSLKLSVGLTPKRNRGYRPDLVVLDGVEAFVDGGPSEGELRRADVVLAGSDRVALDAVGLAVLKELGANDAIMGRGIFEQEQMVRAVELGLGARSGDDIELVTGDPESASYADRLRRRLAAG